VLWGHRPAREAARLPGCSNSIWTSGNKKTVIWKESHDGAFVGVSANHAQHGRTPSKPNQAELQMNRRFSAEVVYKASKIGK
jgi:hypothetical protein